MRTYGTLTYVDGSWSLDVEPHVNMRLKRMFGRVQANRSGAVTMRATDETAADLEWFLSRYPLDVDELTAARLAHSARSYRDAQAAADRILGGERLRFELAPARDPRAAQLEAADLCLTTGRLLLGDALGGGKSFSGQLLFRHPESLPALIVCPTHLARQWLGELYLNFPMLRGHILRTTRPYDPGETREMKGQQPDVLISTYSKLAGWAKHLAGYVRTIIFDEAQELRRSGSDKYCAAAAIADRCRYRMELTATPIYNYGGEIFNVLDVIARDELGTRPEFVREWGGEMSNDRVMVYDPKGLGAYLREQRLLLVRDNLELGIDLQDPVRIPYVIDLDEKVFAVESAGAHDLAQIILAGTGTPMERRQTAGELDWKMRRATGLAKAPHVANFVKLLLESEEKILLFGWHRDVYDVWKDIFTRADIGHVLYTGSESPAQKEAAKKAFLLDPRCRVMIMSLRSGAGLDGLERVCRVAVFGELDWAYGMHQQCIGRLVRNSQPHQVLAYFLTCDEGSDPVVLEALGIKRGQSEPVVHPDAPLFEAVDTSGDRIRRLAAAVVRKK